jgi:2-C-methyl-D-erythritol 4-phosphate cytidylyltransferase
MQRRSHSVGVVIPAAGQGTRYGGRTPKQFVSLKGKSVLQRTIEAFESISMIGQIIVVTSGRDRVKVQRIVTKARLRKVTCIVVGGTERQHSVMNGLLAFPRVPEVVLVHDGVRPMVSRNLILAVAREAARHRAAIAAVPVTDTIKIEGPKGFVARTLDRSKLWAAQTPQGFKYETLLRAHEQARKRGIIATDDASLVEMLGVRVRLVKGSPRNIKLTSKADHRRIEMWLK